MESLRDSIRALSSAATATRDLEFACLVTGVERLGDALSAFHQVSPGRVIKGLRFKCLSNSLADIIQMAPGKALRISGKGAPTKKHNVAIRIVHSTSASA